METVLIYEDQVHEMVLEKIFDHLNLDMSICRKISSGGKSRIDKGILRYANASRHKRIIILRDLDDDAPCPPVLRERLLANVDPLTVADSDFVFRIAVREAEAWLIADRAGFRDFFKLRDDEVRRIRVESLKRPKEKLLKLIDKGRLSVSRKAGFYKRTSNGLHQSPTYNESLKPYIEEWSVREAIVNSRSLERAVEAIANSFQIVR